VSICRHCGQTSIDKECVGCGIRNDEPLYEELKKENARLVAWRSGMQKEIAARDEMINEQDARIRSLREALKFYHES